METLWDMQAFEGRYAAAPFEELTARRNRLLREKAAIADGGVPSDPSAFERLLDVKIELALLDKLLWLRREDG